MQTTRPQPEKCPNCGESHRNLGVHWSSGRCEHPELSQLQLDILTGSMMGDASLQVQNNNNPCIRIHNTNKDYLEYLRNLLGIHAKSINPIVERGKCYRLNVRSNPAFERFNWYSPEKRYPDGLTLNSTIVKHWYCQDGTLSWNRPNEQCYVKIACANEKDRKHWICSLFHEMGFEPWYSGVSLRFTRGESEEILGWMGEPPEGMEYKWMMHNWMEYDRLKP